MVRLLILDIYYRNQNLHPKHLRRINLSSRSPWIRSSSQKTTFRRQTVLIAARVSKVKILYTAQPAKSRTTWTAGRTTEVAQGMAAQKRQARRKRMPVGRGQHRWHRGGGIPSNGALGSALHPRPINGAPSRPQHTEAPELSTTITTPHHLFRRPKTRIQVP